MTNGNLWLILSDNESISVMKFISAQNSWKIKSYELVKIYLR